jgi:PKD repeat protein
MSRIQWMCVSTLAAIVFAGSARLEAATITVAAGGNLQQALDVAQPGDTILLAENAEFVGNFVLPVKTGEAWITLRTAAPDSVLPPAGTRIRPSDAALLARVRSPNSMAALRTAPGAHHWIIQYLEFPSNLNGYNDILQIGDGSSAQNSLDKVPHHLELSHLYVHGDPSVGQKRGIALNAAHVTIRDSHIADCKGISQDTQAIGGWNGPGPYLIENNYLEGAGENVMFGGADPAIPNLVADGIVFRRNYVSRPMSWRDPLLATPAAVTATINGEGSLPPGTYAYRVVARRLVQGSNARSAASVEVTVTTTAPASGVRVQWQPVAGAAEYRVYGRTAGAEDVYWRITTNEFTDSGAAGTAEAVPSSAGTVWIVKNLFELKNARNVVVESNVFENHWKAAQAGYAIVFTPRNSNGACTWCVVEQVRFENNILRNAAAGINLLGYDGASVPNSRQTNNVAITNNVFQLTTALGGNAWFMLLGDEPRDITVSHNTIDANGNAVVYAYGGTSTDVREILGFQMVANAMRHGSYGINGQYFAYGNGILNGYFPGAVFASNYLSGADASRYPAGTMVAGTFTDQFVDTAAGNFELRAGSALKGAGSGGSDIGADFPRLRAALLGVEAGVPGENEPLPPVAPRAGFTLSCTSLSCAFADASTPGDAALVGRTWSFGDGAAVSGVTAGTHTYAAGGTYLVTLTATDANGLTAAASETISVVASNAAPSAGFTVQCRDLTCTFNDTSTDSDGSVVAWDWTFGNGTASGRAPTWTFAAPGLYTVVLTVVDNEGAQSSTSRQVQVTGLVHGAFTGAARNLSNKSGKNQNWTADVTVTIHGADERTVAGATVTGTWTIGTTTTAVSCVTDATGRCTVNSGSLNYSKVSSVSLQVTQVAAPGSVYDASANHSASGVVTKFTVLRP